MANLESAPVYALVAAAGFGERFGGAKLLAPWRGRPLLAALLQTLAESRRRGQLRETLVVHRADDVAIARLTRECEATPVATQPGGELSDSLRTGFAALSARESAPAAALVCLGDQPLLRANVLEALIAAWRAGSASAIRPRYRESPDAPGHPLLLDRSLWHLAERLTGAQGFGALFATEGIPLLFLPVEGSNPDVDTRDDLRALDNPEPLTA